VFYTNVLFETGPLNILFAKSRDGRRGGAAGYGKEVKRR
jgi:hypothetical protein